MDSEDNVAIISIHGLPPGYTVLPEELTLEMKIAMSHAIQQGMTVSQIWEYTLRKAPKFIIVPQSL